MLRFNCWWLCFVFQLSVTVVKNPGLGFSIAGGVGSPGNPFRSNDTVSQQPMISLSWWWPLVLSHLWMFMATVQKISDQWTTKCSCNVVNGWHWLMFLLVFFRACSSQRFRKMDRHQQYYNQGIKSLRSVTIMYNQIIKSNICSHILVASIKRTKNHSWLSNTCAQNNDSPIIHRHIYPSLHSFLFFHS